MTRFWAVIVVGGMLACNAGNGKSSDLSTDAATDLVAGACTKNSDCPDQQFCMPVCACVVDDMGHLCDVFAPSCVPTLQGFPCHVEGDHVVCCK